MGTVLSTEIRRENEAQFPRPRAMDRLCLSIGGQEDIPRRHRGSEHLEGGDLGRWGAGRGLGRELMKAAGGATWTLGNVGWVRGERATEAWAGAGNAIGTE